MNSNETILSNDLMNFNQSDSCHDFTMKDSNTFETINPFNSSKILLTNNFGDPFNLPNWRSIVKENKFNDMKKNTLGKLINRMQKHREDRMDKILYGKQAILDNLKNEIYDDIKYYDNDEFNEYIKDHFSQDNLSFYFDLIAYYFETNNEISNLTEYEANIYQNDDVISFCPYCNELVFKMRNNIICSRNCFNYYIGNFDQGKINLCQIITSLKNLLLDHKSCTNTFELIECNERIIFFCTKCLL